MKQTRRKMTRGVKAVAVVAVMEIAIIFYNCIFLMLFSLGEDIEAKMLGMLFGLIIGQALFPVITLILARGAKHKNAMIVTAVLSFTGGPINIIGGIIALIIYFTDPNRKQYFEPNEHIVEAPQLGAEPQTEGGRD